ANEIMLLAYYIAAVNIETTYHALLEEQVAAEEPSAATAAAGKTAENVPAGTLPGAMAIDGNGSSRGTDVPAGTPGETPAHDSTATYSPFEGIVLADTFQISEADDSFDDVMFPRNNDRITKQLATPITVIVGNPPYSVGQTSANDLNPNIGYPTLDGRITDTYAKRSTAQNKNSLYDSYLRALRWATDRIGDSGIVAFVMNGGWIDGNT